MKKILSIVLLALLLAGCRGGGVAPTSNASPGPKPALTEKARTFLDSVRKDSSGFHFTVSHWYVKPPVGITLVTGDAMSGALNPVRITHSEAVRVAQYFAEKGLLDRSHGLPAGKLSPGWWVHLTTKKVGAHWYLGRETRTLLERHDILGVRSALSSDTAKAWDDFLQGIRGTTTPNKPSEATR